MSELKVNAARCKKCGSIIISRHRHDFVWCLCHNVFVDGGNAYTRIGGPALEDNSYELITDPDELPEPPPSPLNKDDVILHSAHPSTSGGKEAWAAIATYEKAKRSGKK
jgi:hypothetical protein